ncbi:tyrosine-type recombinase/integrase (plasmid) [Streptosporangium sp. CA-135522]|uniref:tyrosine-type recombinase/integrase n=1 Tax=Streptosporangium sp. CA-135522 TaxID=3240072 RepID=UPI003D8F837A
MTEGMAMVDLSRVVASGPLAPFVEGYAAELAGQGYAASSVLHHCRLMGHVSRWLGVRKAEVGVLNEEKAQEFLAEQHAAGRLMALRVGSLEPLLAHLRSVGVVGAPVAVRPAGAVDAVLERFAGYLAEERGLAESTVEIRVKLARPFLDGLTDGDDLDLRSVTAEEVTEFVVGQARLRPASLPPTVTALRSLLRFLHLDGAIDSGLAAAVPTASTRRLAGLPKTLTKDQVVAMLETCDPATAVGLRNIAVLTVLSRLGMRAGEVAALLLDDVDWRRGEISIVGKGTRHERLPLPKDVGSAIVAYLRDARPDTGQRALFLCARGPFRPMSPDAVSNVAALAARKAGLGIVRAHRLRHSAATAMLEAGGSLPEIGQVLRHQHTATTAIYAKVDIAGLRSVARHWPGAEAAA